MRLIQKEIKRRRDGEMKRWRDEEMERKHEPESQVDGFGIAIMTVLSEILLGGESEF